jgi:glycine/D-amino acid oxidase-like deaminating enzyme
MEGHGFECEVISGNAIFEKEQALSRNIKHALYFPNTLQLLEPHQTALKLFDYFIQEGGEYKQAEVTKLMAQNIEAKSGVNLSTSVGSLNFDKAVVCMGAWSKNLCENIDEEIRNEQGDIEIKNSTLKIPLVPERGYHLTYPNSPVKFKHLIKSEDRHLVLTPLNTGMRVTGFGEFSKIMSKPVEKRYPQLNKHMDALIKDMHADQQKPTTWMGRRPTLPDSLPVIDLHPQYSQIGMVFGHQHLGLTQSPISAKLITAMFEGDESNQTLKDFEDVIESFAVTRF